MSSLPMLEPNESVVTATKTAWLQTTLKHIESLAIIATPKSQLDSLNSNFSVLQKNSLCCWKNMYNYHSIYAYHCIIHIILLFFFMETGDLYISLHHLPGLFTPGTSNSVVQDLLSSSVNLADGVHWIFFLVKFFVLQIPIGSSWKLIVAEEIYPVVQ